MSHLTDLEGEEWARYCEKCKMQLMSTISIEHRGYGVLGQVFGRNRGIRAGAGCNICSSKITLKSMQLGQRR